MKTKVVPPFNSVQDALSIELWGAFFDDFVDISIFMIWWSWGDPDQDWLDWQIWPSGRELGSQPQGPGSIPPFPLIGSLWDPTSVLVGGALSGGYFSPKSPIWKWEIVDFLEFDEQFQNLIIIVDLCLWWKCYFLITIVDLALCAGSNLCASRRRTLRGLFFTKKSVLEMRNIWFPGF